MRPGCLIVAFVRRRHEVAEGDEPGSERQSYRQHSYIGVTVTPEQPPTPTLPTKNISIVNRHLLKSRTDSATSGFGASASSPPSPTQTGAISLLTVANSGPRMYLICRGQLLATVHE